VKRSIVLVTLDALRADHCGYVGYDRDTTPTIDRLASDGLAFETAVAPGTNTPSSMTGCFTGQHASQDVAFAPAEDWRRDLSRRATLAQRLSRRGYATGAVHPQVHASRHFGFDSGFDHFEDFLPGRGERSVQNALLRRMFAGSDLFSTLRNVRNVLARDEALTPWERYYEDVLGWATGQEEPFFLWTLLPDTHFPYLPPADYRRWSSRTDMYRANYDCYRHIGDTDVDLGERARRRIVDTYDDTIRYSDAFVRRLRDDLRDRGIDPVFVVHADHGEAFGEHGTYGHLAYPYEEVTHVPLVVHGAGETGRVERPFSLLDLPDLLAAVADDRPLETVYDPDRGAGADGGGDGDGGRGGDRNGNVGGDPRANGHRTGAGGDRTREGRPWAVTQVRDDGRRVTGIRFPDWKYVDRGGSEGDRLFDLASDPGERRDVSRDHPELLAACRRLRDARATENDERDAVHAAFDRLEA
jgi:arylsulfatase